MYLPSVRTKVNVRKNHNEFFGIDACMHLFIATTLLYERVL
jgi:hypothetical protein